MKHLGLSLVLCLAMGFAQAQGLLQERREQAQQDKADLQAKISALQKQIESTESSRQSASQALQASEQAISDIGRRLSELDQRKTVLVQAMDKLDVSLKQQQEEQFLQQKALAAQLRSQYASGLSSWSTLLSGRDPQQIGRELAWLSYVARARTKMLADLQASTRKLAELRRETDASQAQLDALLVETRAQQDDLQDKQAEHRRVLAQVQERLKAERAQEQSLRAHDARLGKLIRGLEKEIVRAEEQARQRAEAAAKREAQRKAEAEMQAEADRKAAERRAQEHRDAAADQASSAQPEQPAPDSGPAETAPRTEPAGGFPGLKKGMPMPVSGEIQGRFGTQRPEGGVWRGIVLRAPAGAAVRAVAAGRVVYAHWLDGFGNLLIVDHGRQYLSIYGYNQTLLHQVGDLVAAGDKLALVGATGGQVEPGLYFELRHEGAPINPQLWLRP